MCLGALFFSALVLACFICASVWVNSDGNCPSPKAAASILSGRRYFESGTHRLLS